MYLRVGSTNRRADEDLIAELRRASLGKSFDEQALPDLNSEVVDFRAASECFAPVRKLKRGDLATLRLLVPHQGRAVPSTGVTDAVVHADYSQRGAPIRISIFDDRVEIESPGLLPAGLTVEDLRRGVSKLRNRVIGRVFQEIGLIEQWRSGIQRMSAACRDAGLPAPLLEELGSRFRVTLFTARAKSSVLDAIDQTILDSVKAADGRSTAQIAQIIKRTPRAARVRLISLVGRGLIREIGTSQEDPKRRYFAASEE